MKKSRKSHTPALGIPYPKEGGFFVLARALFTDDEILKGPELLAWIWLISKAAYKPWTFKHKQSLVKIERGEVVVSVRYLEQAWGWSKSRCAAFLKFLSSPEVGRLSVQRETAAGTVYLLVKYAEYQLTPEGCRVDAGTPDGTALGQRSDKKKAGKELVPSKQNRHVPQGGTSLELPLDLVEAAPSAMPAAPAAQRAPVELKDTEWRQDADFVSLTQGDKGYPKRDGSQGWPDAYRAYKAARRAGTTLEAIASAVAKYRAECFRENGRGEAKFGTDKVKQAATFFSPRTLPEYLPEAEIKTPLVLSPAVNAILSSVPKVADPDNIWDELHLKTA
jgi:hypothetical protein